MKTYHLPSDVVVELLPKIEGYALDCRLLFMGDHLRQLVRTHTEIVHRFQHYPDPEILYKNLQSSAEIQQFYALNQTNGVVSLSLRPSIFEQPGPVEAVDVQLQISRNGHRFVRPLPLDRLRALGNVLPLLRSNRSHDEILKELDPRLTGEETAWAGELIRSLEKDHFFTGSIRRTNHFQQGKNDPRVTFLGHSSLLFQTKKAAVLTDPCFRLESGLPESALDAARLDPLALCLSHSHWDHCNLESLLWFDKNVPIIIPHVKHPTAFNPPIVNVLKMIGFTDIREVSPWESVRIEDIEIFTAPFHGEQDEPGAHIDHFTYVLKTDGLCVYGGADSYQDTFGQMQPVLERIRDEHRPDAAFLPVSKMIYSYKYGGVNGFCRYIDNTLVDQSFQYTASAEDAAEWVRILQPKIVSPYATFNFSPWSTPREVARFAKALRAKGLSSLLYPLRPLDSLTSDELRTRKLSDEMWRRSLVFWFRFGATMKSCDRKLHKLRLYRYFRYRVIGLARRLKSK